MPRVICPICGSPVRSESLAPRTRLHCNKCHTPFHLDKAGEPTLGNLPNVEHEVDALKQKVRENVAKVPFGGIVKASVAAGLIALVWYVFFGPADKLKPTVEKAAQAVAGNDAGYLKSIAAPGTEADVARWYDDTHELLVKRRPSWFGKPETVDVTVGREDPAGQKGSAMVSIHPGAGNARDVSLANPTAMTAGADVPVDFETVWTLDGRGHWRLDGRETYAKAHPPEPPPGADSSKAVAKTARK